MDYIIKDEAEGKEIRFSRLEKIGKVVIEIIDPEVDAVYWNHIEINEEEFSRLYTLLSEPQNKDVE